MKQGLPLWEQHLEKLVLGLSVLVLLGVLAMTLLGGGDITADIDGRSYGAAEVDEVMVEKAQDLGRRLSPDADADTSAFDAIDASGADRFASRLAAGVAPTGSLPRTAPALAAMLLPEEVGAIDVWYHEPRIPSPRIRPQVVQTVDTIQPGEFDRVADLSSMVAGNGDVAWTTPVAMLDLRGIRRELEVEQARATPPRNRIPANWYNDRPYILDVVFERQTLGMDGDWSAPEIVDTLPGSLELRTQIRQAREDDALNSSFKEFVWLNLDDKVKQLELLQPDFFATVNDRLAIGETESFDAVAADGPVDDAEAARRQQESELRRRIRDRAASAARLEATLQELGGALREEDENPGGTGSGSSGGGRGGRGSSGGRGGGGGSPDGGTPGFGSGAGRKSDSSDGSAADRRRRIALTLKLERMQDEVKRLQVQLEELNPEAEAVAIDVDAAASLPDLADADDLLVWAHDLGVEPGKTYRYRCRALLFNPFFARGRQLLPDQQSLAEPFELPSGESDWSDPVTIDPPVTFFVVQATDGGGSLGLGEVRVQLYRYFEGALRSEQFSVQPGEQIGRMATVDGLGVDFSTEWYLVDVIDDPAAPEASGLDRKDNATVVCRRLDGREQRIEVPSRQRADPKRANLEIDLESAADRG